MTAAAAQDAPSADTAPPAVDYTLPRSAEETLVNALPVGDEYWLTITGERLMRRTILKFILTGADGAPAPANTPIALTLDAVIFNPETIEDGPDTVRLEAVPIYQDGAWFVGPYAFDAPGYLDGAVVIGELPVNVEPTAFQIGVYPNAPELPGWFVPVNIALPLGVLTIIIAVLVGRRVTLTREPERG
ncbi:MAG: hypothetical protein SF162_03725 [bacterium]|nr:hypothetical protein [bacterium]